MGCGMREARKPALTPLATMRKKKKKYIYILFFFFIKVLTQQIHKPETDLQWLNHLGRRFQQNTGAKKIYMCVCIYIYSCMDVKVGRYRRLSTKEVMLLNCGVEEDS